MQREMQVTKDAVLTARVPVTLAERVKSVAFQRDRSVSYVVREALEAHVEQKKAA